MSSSKKNMDTNLHSRNTNLDSQYYDEYIDIIKLTFPVWVGSQQKHLYTSL